MESGEFVNIIFKVVRQCNKTQYNTYTVSDAPVFDCVQEIREFLFEKFKDELEPAANAQSFRFGYIAGTYRRISISSSTQLAEAYSLAKKGYITLWADPDVQKKSAPAKRSYSQTTPLEREDEAGL